MKELGWPAPAQPCLADSRILSESSGRARARSRATFFTIVSRGPFSVSHRIPWVRTEAPGSSPYRVTPRPRPAPVPAPSPRPPRPRPAGPEHPPHPHHPPPHAHASPAYIRAGKKGYRSGKAVASPSLLYTRLRLIRFLTLHSFIHATVKKS